jgi:CHAT domain-containing protein
LYLEKGHCYKAEDLFEQALKIRKKLYPDSSKPHDDLAVSLNNLAWKHYSYGSESKAEDLFKQALKIRKKLYPDPSKPHNNLAVSLNNLARVYMSKGHWSKGEDLFKQALIIRKKLFSNTSVPHDNRAVIFNDLSGLYTFTKSYYYLDHSIYFNPFKLWRAFLFKRLRYRLNLQFVAFCHWQDWTSAESVAKLMRDANHSLRYPLSDLLLSSNIDYSLMLCYRNIGRTNDAIYYMESALMHLRLSHYHRISDWLYDLANLYDQAGWIDDTAKEYGRALTIRRKVDVRQNSQLLLLDSYYYLMLCYRSMRQMGRFDDWEWRRLKQFVPSVYDLQEATDPRISDLLWDVANLYIQVGWVDDATEEYKKALTIRRRIDGIYGSQVSTQMVGTLESLANIYVDQELMWEAAKYFDEAQYYRHKLGLSTDGQFQVLGEKIANLKSRLTSFEQWDNLNQDVVNHYEKGNISTAIQIAEQALEIAESIFPPIDTHLANSLDSLANLYFFQGRCAEAETLFKQSLEIRKKLFPDPSEPHNDLATSLGGLANLYRSQGRCAEAETYFKQSLEIRKKLFPDPSKPHNSLATSLGGLANLYRSQGRCAEAKPLFVKSIKIWQKLFGNQGHPNLFIGLKNLAIIQACSKPGSALPLFQQVITLENRWFTTIITSNDSQQRIKDLEKAYAHLEYLLALTQQHFSQDPTAVNKTFDAVLSRKALAATTEASLNQAIRNYPHLTPELNQLQACQKEIATISYAIGSQPELLDQLNNLLKQRSSLQRKLGKSIPAIDLEQQVVDRLALAHILPVNSFLLEFVRYHDYDFTNSKQRDARYAIFIIVQGKTGVTMLDCGLAEPLDAAIKKFRHAQANTNFGGQNSTLADALRNNTNQAQSSKIENPVLTAFLDQILPHIPITGTCFLAPDSHLHILPFHLLKTPDGKYLGDIYQIHYLNTARDLLRRKISSSNNPPLILADPDYDCGESNVIHFPVPKMELQVSDSLEEQLFERLEINKILGEQVAASYHVPCYSGTEASVARLAQLNAPKFLMIATHGFSLPPQNLLDSLRRCPIDQEEIILSERKSEITPEFREYWYRKAERGNVDAQRILAIIDRYGVRPPSTDALKTITHDPMLNSGFALAGANIWRFQNVESPRFGKGVVFAQDITQWNLWGTELALIVTCVSGMGSIQNSEGVFGLRRALAIAGAKYVITSLWKIPTKPSALLMQKFFKLYKSGMHPATALSAAQKYVRNMTLGNLKRSQLGLEVIAELQISEDAPYNLQPLSHPYFWGAWICQG